LHRTGVVGDAEAGPSGFKPSGSPMIARTLDDWVALILNTQKLALARDII
jgi:hypothetical protein